MRRLISAIALCGLLAASSVAAAPGTQATSWVGKQVIPKGPYLVRRPNARVGADSEPRVYLVTGQTGPWLGVRSATTSGWIMPHEVVLLDQSPDWASRELATNPGARWALQVRALVRDPANDPAVKVASTERTSGNDAGTSLTPRAVRELVEAAQNPPISWPVIIGESPMSELRVADPVQFEAQNPNACLLTLQPHECGDLMNPLTDAEARKSPSNARLEPRLATLTRAIEIDPKNLKAYQERSAIWVARKKYVEAIRDLDRVIELDPRSWRAYAFRAECQCSLSNYEQGIADLDKAIQLSPDQPDLYFTRGQFLHESGRFDRGIADFDHGLELDPERAEAYLYRAAAWVERGDLERARKDADRAIELDPGDAGAYRLRGAIRAESASYQDALVDFNIAIELDPNQPDAFIDRGGVRAALGQYEVALADLNHAIQYGTRTANAYVTRAAAWIGMKNYDKAIDDLNDAIRLDAKSAAAFANRAAAWLLKKDYERAIIDTTEAIRLNPNKAAYFANRAGAWAALKELDKAQRDADKAIRLDPRCAIGFMNRSLVWLARKQYDEALADEGELIRLKPNRAHSYTNRAGVWEFKNLPANAIRDYEHALQLAADDENAHRRLAWLLATCPDARFRDGKRALKEATRACELTKWHDAISLGSLAAAYAETGDFTAAQRWQARAIPLYEREKSRERAYLRLETYRARKPYRDTEPAEYDPSTAQLDFQIGP